MTFARQLTYIVVTGCTNSYVLPLYWILSLDGCHYCIVIFNWLIFSSVTSFLIVLLSKCLYERKCHPSLLYKRAIADLGLSTLPLIGSDDSRCPSSTLPTGSLSYDLIGLTVWSLDRIRVFTFLASYMEYHGEFGKTLTRTVITLPLHYISDDYFTLFSVSLSEFG